MNTLDIVRICSDSRKCETPPSYLLSNLGETPPSYLLSNPLLGAQLLLFFFFNLYYPDFILWTHWIHHGPNQDKAVIEQTSEWMNTLSILLFL